MSSLLSLFVWLAFGGYLVSLLLPTHQKNLIFWWAFGTIGASLLGAVAFALFWLTHDSPPLNAKVLGGYLLPDYSFFLTFYFDRIALTYLLVGTLATFLVVAHSRYSLSESGQKRFFNSVLLFYLGYNVVILAGNFVTMLIGWETLALASFLLIAFYRERYPSAKNAVKVFSLYHIGDVGILLALWMGPPLGSGNVSIGKLAVFASLPAYFPPHTLIGIFVSLILLASAAVKSAQVPFSWWLPRAMERLPAASGVLFGALTVHLGVFLLLRGVPFWENQIGVRVIMGLTGLCTSIVATLTARVQSSAPSRIAYSSIAQVGLIFIEVAAGFHSLALIHVAGHALLRTYQLLYLPSKVRYISPKQHDFMVGGTLTTAVPEPGRMAVTLYMLSLKEWNLDSLMYQYVWNPVKWVGRKMDFLTVGRILLFFGPAYLLGWWLVFNSDLVPPDLSRYLPVFFTLIGLVMVMKAFTEQKAVWLGWLLVVLSQFWLALALCFNEGFDSNQIYYILSGIVVAGGAGLWVLSQLSEFEKNLDLSQFHGYVHKHPTLALVFLISCLGLAGFPISPGFIGDESGVANISEPQVALAFLVSLSYCMHGLALIRIYALVFLGPHDKTLYEPAYRAS